MKHSSCLAGLLFLAAISLTAQPAAAQAETPPLGPNVQITITVKDTEENSEFRERRYRMIVRDDGPAARMIMGWRMPLPSTKAVMEGEEETPVTSYVYQNVGMTANLEARIFSGRRIMLMGQIEVSGAKDGPIENPERLPIIGTFQQALNVLLEEGKALSVAEVPDPEGGSMVLELAAEILD